MAPAPAGFESLSEQVLAEAESRFVILNCVTGFETHRNPYFTVAVASAINDWMREDLLARDDRLRGSLVVSTVSTDDAVAEIERGAVAQAPAVGAMAWFESAAGSRRSVEPHLAAEPAQRNPRDAATHTHTHTVMREADPSTAAL